MQITYFMVVNMTTIGSLFGLRNRNGSVSFTVFSRVKKKIRIGKDRMRLTRCAMTALRTLLQKLVTVLTVALTSTGTSVYRMLICRLM